MNQYKEREHLESPPSVISCRLPVEPGGGAESVELRRIFCFVLYYSLFISMVFLWHFLCG